ncbi:MAG: chemotaxis protein CheW [Alphaproteobacteria bacterium]
MDDLLKDFLTETAESMEVLDVELVKLEQNPNDPELLGNIFRLFHTIKGTCGFLGLPRLESVAHAAENVLGKFRDGAIEVTPQGVTLILASLDRIKSLLSVLEETQAEPAGEDKDLIHQLNSFIEGNGQAAAPAPAPAAAPAKAAAPQSLYERVGGMGSIDAAVEVFWRAVVADDGLPAALKAVDANRLQVGLVNFLSRLADGPDSYEGPDAASVVATLVGWGLGKPAFESLADHLKRALRQLDVSDSDVAQLIERGMALIGAIESNTKPAAAEPARNEDSDTNAAQDAASRAPAAAGDTGKQLAVSGSSIRVNVDLLEGLMTLVSEMVLVRNQLLQIQRTREDSQFTSPLNLLNQITTELQEGVMKTRMQPIGNAWQKLPRIIRDLSVELSKKIDLQMVGAETELDRQVLELIKDPLTHMVRNSADHGLENPTDRRAAGKSDTGKIVLAARHEGGHIIIEVTDDGRGLNIDKIKAKAVANGLTTQAEADTMSDQQAAQFIFHAGLSTAEKVTSVSGRGVGMDVVRTNIEKIGGTIEVKSQRGRGSSFVIKIPLTLAIVSSLIVECSGERFAIPQICVVELVRTSKTSDNTVEYIVDTPVLRLRDRLLPLVSLHQLLKLDPEKKASGDEHFIVVTQVGNATFGILVDRVFDTEEIVVKPVAPVLRDISMFSGNTILGDGSVVMILDPNGLAACVGEAGRSETDSAAAETAETTATSDRVALLVFRAGTGARKAVPLSLVARLEEIELEKIEQSDGKPVVQYRGQLMPLIPVDDSQALKESGRQPVIVFADKEHSIGLVVDEIVDIVEDKLEVELAARRAGRLGTAVIAGESTDIVDVGYFVGQAIHDLFVEAATPAGAATNGRRILLVDDSSFFRNVLTPLLTAAGYVVTAAESGSEALNLCESGRDFDLILSDIEMPGMNGFQFAETVRKNDRWQNTPLVALSGHTKSTDIDRGRQAGFVDYVAKYDREALLTTLRETFESMGDAA